MTTPSEQWIVSALREATDRMPLPPESRWIRERRSTPFVSTIMVVGVAATLIIAVGLTIGALRVEPRLVPAAAGVRPKTFAEVEDTEWRITRFAVASDLMVLRPTWVPAGYQGSVACPSPWSRIGTGATSSRTDFSSYTVEYRRQQPDGICASLSLSGQLGEQDDTGPYGNEADTFDARSAIVHVERSAPRTDPRDPPPPYLLHVWWNEPGAHFDVLSNDPALELADVMRIVRSLEPVR